MKQKLFVSVLLFFALSVCSENAYKCDTIYSVYQKREHITYATINVDAPKEVSMNMVADLIDQFRGDPQELFEWAFKGIGKQEGEDNEKNEVLLILKQALYDKKSEIGTLVLDIKVPGFTSYDDVNITSKVSQYELDKKTNAVNVDIFYSNSLLNKAYGTFFVKELEENKTQLSIEIHVRFGWFFNIFISQRRYKNLIEWRTDGFMNNLKVEAEKRISEVE